MQVADLYPSLIRAVENSNDEEERDQLHPVEENKVPTCKSCGHSAENRSRQPSVDLYPGVIRKIENSGPSFKNDILHNAENMQFKSCGECGHVE